MTDDQSCLARLRRPRLLLRAARFGLPDYRRERDLGRLIDLPAAPDLALHRLLQEEERQEAQRSRGDATYSAARHIEVLIALLAEGRARAEGFSIA